MKFTKDTATSLALTPERFEWDDDMPGFGVRVRGSSARWIVQYRVGSKQRRESLGDVRKVTLDAARKIAQTRFAQVVLGQDPAADKAKKRAADKAVKLTFKVVSEGYIASKAAKIAGDKYRQSTLDQLRMHLEKHWAPFRDLPIETIDKKQVAARLDHIIATNGDHAAGRARSNLTAMFTWAMRRGLCETNPVIATLDPEEGAQSRDRVLSDAELIAVWNACEADDFGRIVRLLILTGCRRQEIGGLRWDEINFDFGTMTIPASRTKNHKAHCLHLPPAALDILRSAPIRAGKMHVFGGGSSGFSTWSYSAIAIRERVTLAAGKPLEHWSLHDLRRSMRTGLGKIGIAPHIAELCINHRVGGVQAIYDRHTYAMDIKNALARWADHFLSLVEGKPSNVTPMKRA